MIEIKSEREIALLKEAGRIVALCHEEMKKAIGPVFPLGNWIKFAKKSFENMAQHRPLKDTAAFPLLSVHRSMRLSFTVFRPKNVF